MLACVFVRDDNDKLGDLATNHPLVQLGHDLLDVGLDLVVGRDQHVQTIFLDAMQLVSDVLGVMFGREMMYAVKSSAG